MATRVTAGDKHKCEVITTLAQRGKRVPHKDMEFVEALMRDYPEMRGEIAAIVRKHGK